MNWIPLNATSQLADILNRSHETPCVIFKHSTRCSISSIAKYRLEEDWDFSENEIAPYFLDLIAHRQVSNAVAETLQVHHESPQIILVWQGDCILDSSHLDISVGEIRESLPGDRIEVKG